MTIGEYLATQLPIAKQFVKCGAMPVSMLTNIELYIDYLELAKTKKRGIYSELSVKYQLEPDTIRQYIFKLKQPYGNGNTNIV